MDVIYSAIMDLADKHHFEEYRVVGNEFQVRGVCPLCKGGENHDVNTFSINTVTGAWNCKRGSCTGINGKKEGGPRELFSYFGEEAPVSYAMPKLTKSQKKSFVKPNPDDLKPLTEDIITYCATRKISEQTLRDWNVSSDSRGNMVFPFYRDGELTFVKYRKPCKHKKSEGPKEWRMPNTESILFGMDMVTFNKPLVITEGELDALALYEAGVSNVVSVPSGCNDFEWIDTCYEWLENFNQIILFGDNDEAGLTMISTLTTRLREDRCMIPDEYPEFVYNGEDFNRLCKDANEILMCYGPDALKQIVDACEPAPIKGVLNLASVPFVDPTLVPRIMTKIPALDNMIGGLGEGGLTIISGKRGEGRHLLSINMVN